MPPATIHNNQIDISFQEKHLFIAEGTNTITAEDNVYEGKQAKSSLQIEIEHIQAEKKALLKYKRKQNKLYEKIRGQQI